MAVTEKLLRGLSDTPLTSASLANNAAAVTSTSYTPQSAAYTSWEVFVAATFATAPTTGALLVWVLRDNGSGVFETGSASVTPARMPDVVAEAIDVTGAQGACFVCDAPPGPVQVLIVNSGTGQTATSVSVTVTPFTRQGV